MRLPRVRFSVRRLMIMVAVVALSSAVLGQLSLRYRQQARFYAESEAYWRKAAIGAPISQQARYKDRVNYFARLRQKYEHAARYPWLPVEPDPLGDL